jgi:CheY-like chemotaxis protein
MEPFRLLVVEDNEQDLTTFHDSLTTYRRRHDRDIQSTACRTVEEAFLTLDSSFDGAIIDLRLEANGDGNQITQKILDLHFRIPIAIFTGTPDAANPQLDYLGVFKKGEVEYSQLLDMFWGIHSSGLTRIMGGRGVIENNLNNVFLNNLLPQRETWVRHGTVDPVRTEKALLRYTLNHLLQLLDDDVEHSFPEEVYIHPPFSDEIRTGNIVNRTSDKKFFVVLSPACDLVIRIDGLAKSDQVLLVEIESFKTVLKPLLAEENRKNQQNKVSAFLRNNYSDNFHWLPRTDFFEGGFINFRRLYSTTRDNFKAEFKPTRVQISPPFVKDIIARFSSYYARQGQPDIAYEPFVSKLVELLNEQ